MRDRREARPRQLLRVGIALMALALGVLTVAFSFYTPGGGLSATKLWIIAA